MIPLHANKKKLYHFLFAGLVFIIAIPIVVIALLTAVIVIATIIGIVWRKQQRKSAKQEFEMPEYAAGDKPSESKGTPPASKPPGHCEVRRVSLEYEDMGYSPPGSVDTIKMERNVVYGVGGEADPDAMIINPQTPQPQSQAPNVMTFNLNVAYGVV